MINSRKHPDLATYLAERKPLEIGKTLSLAFNNIKSFFLGYYFFLPILFIAMLLMGVLAAGLSSLGQTIGVVFTGIIGLLVNVILGVSILCLFGGYLKQAYSIRKKNNPHFGAFFEGFQNFKQALFLTLIMYGISIVFSGILFGIIFLMFDNIQSFEDIFDWISNLSVGLLDPIENYGTEIFTTAYFVFVGISFLIGVFIFAITAFIFPFIFVNNTPAWDAIVLSFKYGIKYYWKLVLVTLIMYGLMLAFMLTIGLFSFITPFFGFFVILAYPIMLAFIVVWIYEIFNQVTSHSSIDDEMNIETHLIDSL